MEITRLTLTIDDRNSEINAMHQKCSHMEEHVKGMENRFEIMMVENQKLNVSINSLVEEN